MVHAKWKRYKRKESQNESLLQCSVAPKVRILCGETEFDGQVRGFDIHFITSFSSVCYAVWHFRPVVVLLEFDF